MTRRQALLIGSLPYANEEAAMRKALDVLGDDLFCLPDGEIGDRDEIYKKGRRMGWVQTAIQRNVDSGAFKVDKDIQRDAATGLFKNYQDLFVLNPRYSPKELVSHLNFGYLEFFQKSYPIFKQLREEYKKPGLVFQVGIPTGLAIALLSMSPLAALRYRSAFDERLSYEANEIVKAAGDDVMIQVEVPIEMGLAQRLPGFMMWLLVNMLISLIKRLHPATRLGIHMCLGDLHNKSLVKLDMDGLIVRFANQVLDKFPADHRLEYVHFPFAEGEITPPTDPAVYATLKNIRMPKGARFIAGMVHEKLGLEDHATILKAIEAARGETIGVACSCGMGRRQSEVADRLLDFTHQVAAL